VTYKPDEIRELIPLYLNKRLSEKERQEFEDVINKYPELKKELKEFLEIRDLYKDLEDEIPQPSDTIYKRIMDNIRPETKTSVIKKKVYLEVLKALFSSPRVSWAVVAVQVIIILFLLIRLPEGDKLKTLTSEYIMQGEGVKINIVFDEDAKEKEIREILNRTGATVIGGPSEEGLYIIQIKDQDIETKLTVLRNTRIVRFVERSY